MPERTVTTLGALTRNFDSLRRPVKAMARRSGQYPYFGASGVIDSVDGYTHDGDFLLVAEDGENLRSRSTPIAFMATGRSWINNHAHVVTGNESSDTRYLMHLLSITDISGYLTGSTQPKLTRAAMDSIILKVPPIEEQRAIAEVLGALDDKIAANARRIEAATGLTVALASTGTSTTTLGLVARLNTSAVDPTKMGAVVVDHYSLPAYDNGEAPERVAAHSIKSNKFAVSSPSVLVSKLNPRFPRVWDVAETEGVAAIASTEFLPLVPTKCSTGVLWAILRQPGFGKALEGKVSGTSGSHQRVRPHEVLSSDVIDPGSIRAERVPVIEGATAVIAQTRIESRVLASTRDELLPLLMSGRVRVRDAERLVEGVV